MNGLQKVLLADDHPIFRTGVRHVLEANGTFSIVAEVGDGRAALSQIDILKPHFVVLDLNMPEIDGFSVLKRIKAIGNPAKVVIVSMHAAESYAKRAYELGAIGFIAKEDAPSEIVSVLQNSNGEFYMSQSVGNPDPRFAPAVGETEDRHDFSTLTNAERNVLVLLSFGKTSKEIALELNISPRTVQAHRRNIADKLDVHGTNRLLEIAISHRTTLIGIK
ncbi:response regulator transcription factor [Hoeflea sp. WL0058]|uniref:Response regulator transcription factor n=1 Tax=Flavimaribacter sediminis TaxID=2865987 RepID=A0AAE2ZQY7_9HYPH|nr:response regulator transcription factor [Flavimaribacter sediminis]MBW8639355.1 response regulator transcription factor [Flavimaribacter sediminis]